MDRAQGSKPGNAIRIAGRDSLGRHRMLSADMEARQIEAVGSLVAGALAEVRPEAAERARNAVTAFYALYDERPVEDNKGGSGFNDSLWLFVVASVLRPEVIVESGVFKGHSTWLLRRACPEAEIHCFDPELGNLVYRDPGARYHAGDWTEVEIAVTGRRSLAFFDDHMDQGRRVLEAQERGFRHLLFDDNFPAMNLYATGHPPLPSLAMIFDESLPEAAELSWVRNGKVYEATLDMTARKRVKSLIELYSVLPDLAPMTRYSPGSGLTLVKLFD